MPEKNSLYYKSLIIEAENIVNSWPLRMYVSEDCTNSKVLKPNYLFIETSGADKPPLNFECDNRVNLTKQ